MDIRGLILINSAGVGTEENAQFSALPFGMLDVAGKNPLQRVSELVKKFGIAPVTAVIEGESWNARMLAKSVTEVEAAIVPSDRFWRSAENAFNDLAQSGAELVLLVRLGAYAELDFEKFIQFHLDNHCRVSQAAHYGRPLEIFCISASRRNDAASLFRSQLSKCRSECPQFEHSGYVNPLSDAHDLRQLAVDILTLHTETAPAGEQIRPGVWVSRGANIEKGARLLAPAYIGSRARIRSGVVITRCTSVEHHAQVDCGTVIENSSVLPYCYVGAGLELAHSVAGFSRIANLRRLSTVKVYDEKLLRHLAAASGNGLLASAADLVTYVPRQFWRGVVGQTKAPQPDLNTVLRQTSPTLGHTAGYRAPACNTEVANEFPSNFVVARTNGNQ
jgi:hypothetical protein